MDDTTRLMVQQIAAAVAVFQEETTGHAPSKVSVVLSEDTIVVTLQDALSPAEKALAQNSAGAVQIQEFHRRLFANASASLRQEIKTITGREIREAAAEVMPVSGAVTHAFTTGTVVQVFLFAGTIPTKA